MSDRTQTDPLKPDAGLLCKIGSAVVHADEAMSPKGVEEDRFAFQSVLSDPAVDQWLREMTEIGLLPVKRNA